MNNLITRKQFVGTALAAGVCGSGMAAAAAWTLKRPVSVYVKPGEFKRGLERAGIPPVTPKDLEKMLPRVLRGGRQVVVLTRSKNRLREMPPKGMTIIRRGRLAAVFYGGGRDL